MRYDWASAFAANTKRWATQNNCGERESIWLDHSIVPHLKSVFLPTANYRTRRFWMIFGIYPPKK